MNETLSALVRDLKQREHEYLKAKGITRTQLMQSAGYAEAYGAGVARRLAGKKPVLNVLAEHGVSVDEFHARINKRGGDFATAVDAVVAEIERGD
jgi:hypothetical protein